MKKKELLKYFVIILASIIFFGIGIFISMNDKTIISIIGFFIAICSLSGITYVIKDIRKKRN